MSSVDPFAGRDGDANLRGGLFESRRVFGRYWLFDPARLELLQLTGHVDGGRRIEPAVHLDENVHVRSDGVANRVHERDRSQFLLSIQLIETCAERIQL